MSGANVTQEMVDRKPLLLQKIESNPDLANVLLALLGRIILESAAKGYKINGVRLSEIHEVGNGDFRCRISYQDTSLIVPVKIMARSDFATYMAGKNIAMARALSINPSIAQFFEAVTMRLEQYAEHKRIPFPELKVLTGGAFISRDNELVIRVGKEDTGVTENRKLKKFFGL
jgi:hypothetical protein